MEIDLQPLDANRCYHLMTQTIIPRPIAWVLTANQTSPDAPASYNLAPFSFFNALCSDPPLVMLSMGQKAAETPKDTRKNFLHRQEMVIHLPCVRQAADVTLSAAPLDYGDSELTPLQEKALSYFPGSPLPRLAAAPVAFYARFYDVHYLGPKKQAIFYAELLKAYVCDEAIAEDKEKKRYRVNAEKLDPLARLGGSEYAGLGKPFIQKRP